MQQTFQTRLAQMVAGSVTFDNLQIDGNSAVIYSRQVAGGAIGDLSQGMIVNESSPGAGDGSVAIGSSSGTETSWIQLLIINTGNRFSDA